MNQSQHEKRTDMQNTCHQNSCDQNPCKKIPAKQKFCEKNTSKKIKANTKIPAKKSLQKYYWKNNSRCIVHLKWTKKGPKGSYLHNKGLKPWPNMNGQSSLVMVCVIWVSILKNTTLTLEIAAYKMPSVWAQRYYQPREMETVRKIFVSNPISFALKKNLEMEYVRVITMDLIAIMI